jgi:hypothetical protein
VARNALARLARRGGQDVNRVLAAIIGKLRELIQDLASVSLRRFAMSLRNDRDQLVRVAMLGSLAIFRPRRPI